VSAAGDDPGGMMDPMDFGRMAPGGGKVKGRVAGYSLVILHPYACICT
jgi:hypothetical protein